MHAKSAHPGRRFARLAALALGLAGATATAADDPGWVVASWNLHHGRGADGRIDLARIAARILTLDAAVVVLQEVDRRCGRSGGVDQAAELGRLTGMRAEFGAAMPFDGGEYGLAVLSRLPIRETRVHRLPGDGEPRIVFEAVVDTAAGPVSVGSVHLDHQDANRRLRQAEAARAALAPRAHPVVLAGDFNDHPDSPVMRAFAGDGWSMVPAGGPTHPADQPQVAIDHVVLRGAVQPLGPLQVIAEPVASDHRPISVRLKRNAAATAPSSP